MLDDRLTIACGVGALRLLEVQRAGKAPMTAEEFLRGARIRAGAHARWRGLMPRYKLTIEYDGTGFVGWQRQANGLSIQEAIETALAALCGDEVAIRGAGRTDAGVHALGPSRPCRSCPRLAAGRFARRAERPFAAAAASPF